MKQSIDDAYDDPKPAMFIKPPTLAEIAASTCGIPPHSRAAQVAIAVDSRPKAPAEGSLRAILDNRGSDYGDFTHMARVAQDLKAVMASGFGPTNQINPAQQESLDMICTKLARIACGNPNKVDTWTDIAGYATLIADLLKKEKQA